MSIPALTPGAGDQVAVVDVPGVDVGDDGRVELGEQVERRPVRGGRPSGQQTGGRVDEAAGAHAGQQRDGGALGAHPVQVLGVAQQPPGADAARVDEDVEVRSRRPAEWCAPRTRPLAPVTPCAVGGEARDRPPVLGVLQGPEGEHLPGSDGVELLDPVEQQQSDLAMHGVPPGLVGGPSGRRRRLCADAVQHAAARHGIGPVKVPGSRASGDLAGVVRSPRAGGQGERTGGPDRARRASPPRDGRLPRGAGRARCRQVGPGRRARAASSATRWCCAPRGSRSRRRWRSPRSTACCDR